MSNQLHTHQRNWFVAITALLASLAIALAVIGQYHAPRFTTAIGEHGPFVVWSEAIMDAVSLLTLNQIGSAPQNQWFAWARVFAILFGSSAIFTILISVSRSLSVTVSLMWLRGRARLRPSDSHSVVIGLGEDILPLIRDILQIENRPVVVLASSTSNGLKSNVEAHGGLVLNGEKKSPSMWSCSLLDQAREVFITSGESTENVDIAASLLEAQRTQKIVRAPALSGSDDRRIRRLQCHVHVNSPEIASLFRTHDLFPSPQPETDVHVFSSRQKAAQSLLLDEEHGIASRFAPTRDEVFHGVVFGFRSTGQAVALQMARLAHFSNLYRPRLTLVDRFTGAGQHPDVSKARADFLDRYPAFCPNPSSFNLLEHVRSGKALDEWQYRGARPASPDARREESRAVEYVANAEFLSQPAEPDAPALLEKIVERMDPREGPAVQPALVICYENEHRNFQVALEICDELQSRSDNLSADSIPIFVYLPTEDGLASLLRSYSFSSPDSAATVKVIPFGQHSQTFTYSNIVRPKLDALARRYHEAYMRKHNEDTSFDDLSPKLRKSNYDAAAHAIVKLSAEGGYNEAESSNQKEETAQLWERLAQMEHNRWMGERLLEGWRYAPQPDGYDSMSPEDQKRVQESMDRQKLRSSLVPWVDLSEMEREKDRQQIEIFDDVVSE